MATRVAATAAMTVPRNIRVSFQIDEELKVGPAGQLPGVFLASLRTKNFYVSANSARLPIKQATMVKSRSGFAVQLT
jgi:hypothetical protein